MREICKHIALLYLLLINGLFLYGQGTIGKFHIREVYENDNNNPETYDNEIYYVVFYLNNLDLSDGNLNMALVRREKEVQIYGNILIKKNSELTTGDDGNTIETTFFDWFYRNSSGTESGTANARLVRTVTPKGILFELNIINESAIATTFKGFIDPFLDERRLSVFNSILWGERKIDNSINSFSNEYKYCRSAPVTINLLLDYVKTPVNNLYEELKEEGYYNAEVGGMQNAIVFSDARMEWGGGGFYILDRFSEEMGESIVFHSTHYDSYWLVKAEIERFFSDNFDGDLYGYKKYIFLDDDDKYIMLIKVDVGITIKITKVEK